MKTTEKPVKNSPLLEMLVRVGDDIDTMRNAVLECVCSYHDIPERERYINSEYVIRYEYNRFEKEDECEVKLYARKEYEAEHDEHKCFNQPKCVMYSMAYVVMTPVHVIQEYIEKHYTVCKNIYGRLFKKI